MNKRIKTERIGEKFINNQGLIMELIEYINSHNCTVRFEDGTIIKKRDYHDIKRGLVNNVNCPTFCNIGYIGVGKYIPVTSKKLSKSYKYWMNMINRCYGKNYTYKDCTVAEEWHNYQNFAKWFEENYNSETMQNWHLDKDILIKGNKVYGPNTCCFVPNDINILFVRKYEFRGNYPLGVSKSNDKFSVNMCKKGKKLYLGKYITPEESFLVYKINKESYIKEVANKFKNLLSADVYNTMVNYGINIED